MSELCENWRSSAAAMTRSRSESSITLPDISRCETAKREKEPGDTCCHRGHQKKAVHPAAEDDQSRDDAPEADEDEDGRADGSSPCLRYNPGYTLRCRRMTLRSGALDTDQPRTNINLNLMKSIAVIPKSTTQVFLENGRSAST